MKVFFLLISSLVHSIDVRDPISTTDFFLRSRREQLRNSDGKARLAAQTDHTIREQNHYLFTGPEEYDQNNFHLKFIQT